MNAEQVIAEELEPAGLSGRVIKDPIPIADDIAAALRAALADPESRDEVLRSLGMVEEPTTHSGVERDEHPLYRFAEPASDRTVPPGETT